MAEGVGGYLPAFLDRIAFPLFPYLDKISLSIVASLLFMYGEEINEAIRKPIQALPFVLRVLVFMFVCAFGYGALTVLATHWLALVLRQLPGRWLLPLLLWFLILVGFLAQKKRHI